MYRDTVRFPFICHHYCYWCVWCVLCVVCVLCCVCVVLCVHACERACVRACVRVYVCVLTYEVWGAFKMMSLLIRSGSVAATYLQPGKDTTHTHTHTHRITSPLPPSERPHHTPSSLLTMPRFRPNHEPPRHRRSSPVQGWAEWYPDPVYQECSSSFPLDGLCLHTLWINIRTCIYRVLGDFHF